MTATIFRADQELDDTQILAVGADQTSSSDHKLNDIQRRAVAAGSNFPDSQGCHETHARSAVGDTSRESGSDTTKVFPQPTGGTSLSDPLLALAADVLDDAESTRIANENRLRQLTRTETDSDGEERGFGLDESDPDVAKLAAIVQLYVDLEHQSELNLKRQLRKHPLYPWIKAQKGIGDKQAARLLAVVGDPYINEQTGEARNVAKLWAYCGHGDPSRRKAKGMSQADMFALGNPVAKSRLWLISCACLKAQGHYADIYYDRKDMTEGRLHAGECRRCGPSGHPAQAGSPWSNAHRHADALRVMGKTILRDLWIEARRIHEGD